MKSALVMNPVRQWIGRRYLQPCAYLHSFCSLVAMLDSWLLVARVAMRTMLRVLYRLLHSCIDEEDECLAYNSKACSPSYACGCTRGSKGVASLLHFQRFVQLALVVENKCFHPFGFVKKCGMRNMECSNLCCLIYQ